MREEVIAKYQDLGVCIYNPRLLLNANNIECPIGKDALAQSESGKPLFSAEQRVRVQKILASVLAFLVSTLCMH